MTSHLQDPAVEPRSNRFGFALVAGIALIAGGILLALENAGISVPESVLKLWPLLIVLFGLARLNHRGPFHLGGHVLIFFGLFFLGLQFAPVQVARYSPPIGLLWLGVIITLRALQPATRHLPASDTNPELKFRDQP